MRTTADFARESFLANFFCGGLNFQIEHHLFPKICHVHYYELSKIVERTAKEFGVPYNDNKTFWDAMKSHYKMLKIFGQKDYTFSNSAQPVVA
jgi:linoleoyl-CoA desaturase